ncbi:unnamed protein product [Dibothriocephalus latus]|uniref:Aminopeptidase P N-terminal domain-containing protein n=1 Tax=Dibothriocephalus latus TaxID=60516 RepID=A0A3P7LMD8_DIBLA|nr:unnamed protein product [Dibothriocephalus latus]
MSLHVPYAFRQDSNFRYLTGILEPGAVLTLEVSAINTKSDFNDNIAFVPRLFVEERNDHDRVWDGPTMGVEMASQLTGIQDTQPLTHLSEYLTSAFSQLQASSDFIWFGLPFLVRRKEKAPIYRTIFNQTSELFSKCSLDPKQLQDPEPLLDELRLIKSSNEIALMRRAAEVTSTALKKTMRAASPGVAEAELCTRFEHESRMMGSRRFTKEQRILHDVLVQVQRDCQQAVNPDASLQDLYELMLQRIGKYLVEEKIMLSNDAAAMAHKICPHHVGHFLGLDVHDTPSIPYSRKFQPGMVFPLEPGIYFPTDASNTFHIPTEFCGLGLRLEDDFVMTVEGRAEKLTKELSSDASDLESYVKGVSCSSTN